MGQRLSENMHLYAGKEMQSRMYLSTAAKKGENHEKTTEISMERDFIRRMLLPGALG